MYNIYPIYYLGILYNHILKIDTNTIRYTSMSLQYFARYRFQGNDFTEEDFGLRHLALESGSTTSQNDNQFGECVYLDGATSLLSLGDFSNIANKHSRAFTFWAKNSSSYANPVVSYGELSATNAFVIYAKNKDGFTEVFDYQTRNPIHSQKIVDDEWVFYAIVYDNEGQVLRIYLNGQYVQEVSDAPLDTGNTDPLRIGTDGLGEYFKGNLLDLRIWDETLAATAISYMYSVGPNFKEQLQTSYANQTAMGQTAMRATTVMGNLLCRTMYGVQNNSSTHVASYFGVDSNDEPCEVARVECNIDDNEHGVKIGTQTTKIRDTNDTLQDAIKITPSETTFFASGTNSNNSIVFSFDGVHLLAGKEKGCLYFGAGRDFRIRTSGDSFFIEAFSSATNSYHIKLQIQP